MKKNVNLMALCTLGLSLSLSSCFENTGDHYTEILYPKYGEKTLYADQTKDSLVFISFDSWTLDTVYGALSNKEKLAVSFNPADKSGIVQKNYYVRKGVPFNFTANTSDTIRTVFFTVSAYKNTFTGKFKQAHYHNIERPERRNFNFVLTDTAAARVDSLVFDTYTDWNMEIQDAANHPWVSLAKSSGNKGKNIVRLNMEENKTNADREATIVLTSSNEAKTEIKLIQQKPKQKK